MHDDDTRQPDMVTHLQRFADAVDPLHRHRGSADSARSSLPHQRAHIEAESVRVDLQKINAHIAKLEDIADALAAERDALIRYARALEAHHIDDSDFTLPDMESEIRDLRAEHGVAALLEDVG